MTVQAGFDQTHDRRTPPWSRPRQEGGRLVAAPEMLTIIGTVIVAGVAGFGAAPGLGRHVLVLAGGLIVLTVARCLSIKKIGRPLVALLLPFIAFLYQVAVLNVSGDPEACRNLRTGIPGALHGELTKFAVVLLTALLLARREHEVRDYRAVAQRALIFVGPLAWLTFAADDPAAAAVVAGAPLVLLFAGGVPWRHLARFAVMTWPLTALAWLFYVHRMGGVLHSWFGTYGTLATFRSVAILHNATLTGVGLGNGHAEALLFPAPRADYTFTLIVDEFGWLGGALVLLLFALFVRRGFEIAASATDRFGRYFALGLTVLIGVEVFVHIAVCSGWIPPGRQTLPFVSDDPSSIVGTMLALGLLLGIAALRRAPHA